MPEYKNTYSFVSKGAPADAFEVIRFSGVEGLSTPYEFDILLMSKRRDLDMEAVVQSRAVLTLELDKGNLPFHGVPALFETQNAHKDRIFYRLVLVPKLWLLTLTRHNQIFLNQDLAGFLGQALTDGGLTAGQDFEFRLSKSYPTREYVCQYRETHFNFVSRWMERDGLYYFFEQTEAGEKMVITDARSAHGPMAGAETLRYLPPSGLDWPLGESSIKRFSMTRASVPRNVVLTDYDYRKPSAPLRGESLVSERGQGEERLYGEHLLSETEGRELAKVRAEALSCRENLFRGLGSVPHVRSGYLFSLENHFRQEANQGYLTVEVRHEGGQEAYLAQAYDLRFPDAPDMPYYRNEFTAIAARTQFRMERRAQKPQFYGVMNAKIDAAQSGEYAEVDDQGRYKVILPFDLSGRRNGKASSWLRMNQPYGGSDMGFHFPLHKGTEVLLTFMDGDPDRPVIQAAVPNPEHKSLITSDNSTKSLLTTSGGNKMHVEDMEGSERILLQSPTANSYARCGQPNDPPPSEADDMYGWKLNTSNAMLVRAGLCDEMVLGTVQWLYLGNYALTVVGEALTAFGVKKTFGLIKKIEINFLTMILRARRQRALGEQIALSDECMELAGEVIKMRTNATNLETMRNDLRAKRTTLGDMVQELSDTKQDILANRTALVQQRTALTQDVQRLRGEETRITQARQNLSLEKQAIDGQKDLLVQQRTLVTTSNQDVGGQIERLQAMRTELGEMRSSLVGFRTLT